MGHVARSTARETLDNAAIAARLEALAALLDLADASFYTARAYRRAAELIRSLEAPVAELVATGRARELRGIGPGIEARLRELVETGDLEELRELERTVAPELVGLGRYLGLSAKRAVEIGRALGVQTADEFRAAVREGRLRSVPGIGPKTEAKLQAALEREDEGVAKPRRGLLLHRARPLVEGLASELGGEVAGDPRRWRDSSEHLSIVCRDNNALDRFGELPQIVAVVERDDRRAVGVTVEGVPVEVVVAEPGSFGTDWLRATGSAAYVAARERGYDYLAICDHTPSVGAVPGLSASAVRKQAEEIAEANERVAPFRILRGIECDILRDGTLDLPDDVLAELDWVMASVHGGQRGSREEVTMRVVEAMRNPSVRAISHPKGRILNHRPENALDLEEAFRVGLETGTALEVNGLPDRLDLSGEHVREAIAAGVEIVVSTDAHSVRGLGNMELGVRTARRGWATAANVVNTRPLSKILSRGV